MSGNNIFDDKMPDSINQKNIKEMDNMILIHQSIQFLNESTALKLFNEYQKKHGKPKVRIDIVEDE